MTTQVSTDGAPVTRRRRSSSRRSDFHAPDYRLDSTKRIPARIAHFLDFAAERWPRRPLPHNVVLMFVMGFDRVPSMNDTDIKHMKSAIQRAKKILGDVYSRGFVTVKGVGIRATTDAEDRTEHELIPAGNRLDRAGTKFVAIRSSIDQSEFTTSEHGKALKSYFTGTKEIVRQFRATSETIRALLPPPPTETPSEE
jgi:hypothetical protein